MTYQRRSSLYSTLACSALLTAALSACSSPPAVQPPGPGPTEQPTVTQVNFVYLDNTRTLVNPRASISAEIQLPAGASAGDGVDSRTLTADSVYVVDATTGVKAPADLNTSGGGDVIVLAPGKGTTFKANTKYTFQVTGNLKDLDGAGFKDFSASFTTGNIPPLSGAAAFTQVPLGDYQNKPGATVPDKPYTAVKIGPDNRLYASTLAGEILRFDINSDGTLGKPTTINTVSNNNGGPRTIIGMAFDPASTASNPILWISNNAPYDFQKGIPDWSGKISRLSGPDLGTYQDYVTGLPRSIKDHMTNSLAFRPGEQNVLYITQGSSNSFGDPDAVWGCRPEHLLSGALLRLDLNALGTASLPLNARTDNLTDSAITDSTNNTCGAPATDPNYTGPFYNPYASGAPLTLYATGLRNAYSLIWHSNGHLYAPTNGSASGGNAPAEPSTPPAICANRFDHGYTSNHYLGGPAPAIKKSPNPEADYLFDVAQGGYYGHPNPTRCEYILNGGNPTSGTDPVQVPDYPVGVKPDPNYRGAAFVFPVHTSADGVIEYMSAPAHPVPALDHKLLVTRFSAGRDVVALTPNPNGSIAERALGNPIAGLQFSPAPLNMVENLSTGDLYVAQLNDAANGGSDPIITNGTITLVRPQ